MNWTVEYSLGENDEFLTQRTVFFNPDSEGHPWMSWSNAGVPARPDTEFHFPMALFLCTTAKCGASIGRQKVHGASQTCIG